MESNKYISPLSRVSHEENAVFDKPKMLSVFVAMAWIKIVYCILFVFYSIFAISFNPVDGFWKGFNDTFISSVANEATGIYGAHEAGLFSGVLLLSLLIYLFVLLAVRYKKLIGIRSLVICDSIIMLSQGSFLITSLAPVIVVFLPQIKRYFKSYSVKS